MQPGYGSEEARWQAVQARDTGAVGAFLYAVVTTGVYCRPGCASRLPRRDNIRFFTSGAEARRAGFRPCRRCRPDGDTPDPRQAAIRKACALLERSPEQPDLDTLASAAGVSASHFHRLFTEATGATPGEYAAAVRRRRLQEGLGEADTVTEAIYEAGYGSGSRVYEASDSLLGMSPARFRQGGAGEDIRYALAETSLGTLLIAGTERGLCMVEFGEAAVLREKLHTRFSRAEVHEGDPAFGEWVRAVVGLVEEPGRAASLPLDVRATAFQQRVWKALRATRPGEKTGYAELAATIGASGAARAVARACASNPVALVIPCHRVVPKAGQVGGYRWGSERKEALLRREAEAAGAQTE